MNDKIDILGENLYNFLSNQLPEIKQKILKNELHTYGFNGSSAEIINRLACLGVNINFENYFGESALHVALKEKKCDIEIIKALLKHGASLNKCDNFKKSPLHAAIENKNLDLNILKLLISRGCDINLGADSNEQSPLECLLLNRYCCSVAVKLLLENGARVYKCSNLNTFNEIEETILDFIYTFKTYFSSGNVRLDVLQEIFSYRKDFMTILSKLFKRHIRDNVITLENNYDILLYFIKMLKIKPNDRIYFFDSVFKLLCFSVNSGLDCDTRTISLLIEYGASVNYLDYFQDSPLHMAMSFPIINVPLIQTLLNAGAIVCKRNWAGITPLGIGMRKYEKDPDKHENCIKLLLRHSVKQVRKHRTNFRKTISWTFLCPDVTYNMEKHAHLLNYVHNCHKELNAAKAKILSNSVSFFDVIKMKSVIAVSIYEIVSHLQSNSYPIYNEIIAESLPKSQLIQLLHVFGMHTRSESSEQSSKFVSKIYLVCYCVDNIAKYLNNEDLLNICLAYFKHIR